MQGECVYRWKRRDRDRQDAKYCYQRVWSCFGYCHVWLRGPEPFETELRGSSGKFAKQGGEKEGWRVDLVCAYRAGALFVSFSWKASCTYITYAWYDMTLRGSFLSNSWCLTHRVSNRDLILGDVTFYVFVFNVAYESDTKRDSRQGGAKAC